MAGPDKDIVSIIDPDLSNKLDPLSITDVESEDADLDPNAASQSEKPSNVEGEIRPVVKINTNTINSEDLRGMELEMWGFIPKLHLTISDINDKMTELDYPKDGDVVSVYLRPKVKDAHRSIRADFDIRNVDSNPGNVNKFDIYGTLKVPGLFNDRILSFSDNTSFEHLMDVVEEVGLGFASNVDSTDDRMTRIVPNYSLDRFIKDTTSTSYKSDEHFFTSFIDLYYYLNLVDVNGQFTLEEERRSVKVGMSRNWNSQKGVNAQDGFETELRLSNGEDFKGTDMFITKYSPNNNTASVWMENGYKKFAQYFDMDEESYSSEFVDPLTTEGAENDMVLMKGRKDEDLYEDQERSIWLGKMPNGDYEGVHENYQYARIQNDQNLKEITKMTLTVELAGYNTNLYMYQSVPVVIYTMGGYSKQGQKQRDKLTGDDKQPGGGNSTNPETDYDSPSSEVKVEFLSGNYVIIGMRYKYRKGGQIRQELLLSRREWPIPGNVDQPQI